MSWLQVWLKESEDVTWERVIEVLASLGHEELAKSVREKFSSPPETEEVTKPANQSLREKVQQVFLVPINLYLSLSHTHSILDGITGSKVLSCSRPHPCCSLGGR